MEGILCSSCEFSVHVKQVEVTRDQYKLLGVVETFLEMMRVSQKMNWICLRTQQMKGGVALILTIAAAFSCMAWSLNGLSILGSFQLEWFCSCKLRWYCLHVCNLWIRLLMKIQESSFEQVRPFSNAPLKSEDLQSFILDCSF